MKVHASYRTFSWSTISFVTSPMYVLIAVCLLCWTAPGSASLSSSPGQINGVVTACRSEPISLTCTHNNTITGNTRWVVGPPVDCAKTISSSVPPGQSCEPIISFQDVSVLSEGIVSSRATVNTANTSVNSTVLECRDGAGILFNTVGNVSICILDSVQLPIPSKLTSVKTEKGLEVSWDSVTFKNCFFSFNVVVSTVSGEVVRNLPTNTTSVLVTNLPSGEQYNISVTSVTGSACVSNSASKIFTIPGDGVQPWVIPVSVVIPIFFLIVVASVVIAIIAFILIKRQSGPKLERIKDGEFETLVVDQACGLQNLLERHGKSYKDGYVYYEFTRGEEDISEDKKVILKDKKTWTLYTGSEACKMIGAPGESVKRPKLKRYKVFVQSKGLGYRPLEKGTEILYQEFEETDMSDMSASAITPTEQDRVPDPKSYKEIKSDEGVQLEALIKRKRLRFKPGCAFIELGDKPQDIDRGKEVIVVKRKDPLSYTSSGPVAEIKNGKSGPSEEEISDMFTGPAVLRMIGAPDRGITLSESVGKNWRVFVQSTHLGVRYISEDTAILYKEPMCELQRVDSERFKKYHVEDLCELRDFVEHQYYEGKQLNYSEPLQFFFEFANKVETITDNDEVVLMDKEGVFFTGREAFEMVGAPGKHINNPHLDEYKVFIRNSGSGKRALNPGTSLLYDTTCQV